MMNYDHYLSRFITYAKLSNPEDITYDIIREYRLWLNRQSAGTAKKRTSIAYAQEAHAKLLPHRTACLPEVPHPSGGKGHAS